MRRGLACLVVVVALIVLSEHRLSDGQPWRAFDPPPGIWDPVYQESVVHAAPTATCALVFSLDRASSYTLTSAEEGVRFDIDGDGDLEQVAWTPANSDVAFLALDRDGDGRITSGRELITSHAAPGATTAPDALAALARDASRGTGHELVNTQHPLFPRLVLWRDLNHDGTSESSELRAAAQRVRNVRLGFQRHHRRDRHGNESRYRGFVHIWPEKPFGNPATRENDARYRRWMYDACLVTR